MVQLLRRFFKIKYTGLGYTGYAEEISQEEYDRIIASTNRIQY